MEYIKSHWELPQRKMQKLWWLWTLEARTHRSRTRLESEQPPQQVQRPAALEGTLGEWGGLWLPVRERTLTEVIQEKHLLFLCFDFYSFFWIFLFFFPLLLHLLILMALWNLIKLLTFFFSQSHFLLLQTSASMLGFCSSVEFSFFLPFLYLFFFSNFNF